VEKIARCVDRMLVLFPFETDFYRGHGVRVAHVGHPLVDEVPRLPQAWDAGAPAPGPFRLALLPGSRESEVRALLPVLLRATRLLQRELPVEACLIQAPGLPAELFRAEIERQGVAVDLVQAKARFAAIAGAHLAVCASGTATLEVGLLGTPQVVVYRLSAWSYLLGLLLVRLPYVSLVNLVLQRRAAPELLQRRASAEGIAGEAARLLRDPAAIATMRAAFGELRGRLGEGGASRRAAAEVAALLAQEAAA
jgi:lipid-A-disaccharide synthase